MIRAHRPWLVLTALLLSGCLLPQPDTPIIPPINRQAPMPAPGAPAQAPADRADVAQPMAGGAESQLAKPPAEGHGVLMVGIQGATVTQAVAVPEGEGEKVTVEVANDGFRVELLAGGYRLDLTLEDGRTVRVDAPVAITEGATTAFNVEVTTDPLKATVKEEPEGTPDEPASPAEEPVKR